MKSISLAKVAAAGALAVGVLACGDLTGLNDNPNSPTVAPPGALFTRAVERTASRWIGSGYNLRQTEWLAQHFGEVFYPDEDRYVRLGAAQTTGSFDNPYVTELEDLEKVIEAGQDLGKPGISAPAMVLQTYGFGYITDSFGDIPYSDALNGDDEDGALLPTYDAQKDIYDGFFSTLDQATQDLASATGTGLGSADPIYGGDFEMWEKFSNSLRLRFAMRLSNVDPTTASAQLQAALNAPGGVFENNGDAATIPWPGDGIVDNPWTVNFQTRDDHRMSRTLMDILIATDDPRMPIYAQPVQDSSLYPGGYGGMPNGLSADSAGKFAKIASRPGEIFYGGQTTNGYFGSPTNAARPSYFMTYAEVAFIKAEAAERGWGGLNAAQAKGFYEDGIRSSMEQWGVTDQSAIDDYIAQPAVAYKGGVDGLKQIGVQKWVAFMADGGQAWAEWRRTCQPETIKPGPAAIVNFVPRRFYYSTTETQANGANVAAAVARQGPDDFHTRMYWDSQKGVTCPAGYPQGT